MTAAPVAAVIVVAVAVADVVPAAQEVVVAIVVADRANGAHRPW
jgi:hypothetical protein